MNAPFDLPIYINTKPLFTSKHVAGILCIYGPECMPSCFLTTCHFSATATAYVSLKIPSLFVCCSLCNAVCPFSTRLLVAFHPPQKKPVNMCEWLNLTLNVVTLSHENILKRLYCLNVLTEVSGSGLLLTLIVHCNLLQAIRSL